MSRYDFAETLSQPDTPVENRQCYEKELTVCKSNFSKKNAANRMIHAMARDTRYDSYKKQKSASFRKLRRWIEYWVVIGLSGVAGIWPIRVNQKAGTILGLLAYRLARKDRGIAEYQVDFCFPELSSQAKKQMVMDTFINLGKTLMETLVLNKFRKNRDRWIQLVNADVVEEASKQGRGIIIVFGHLANWELIGIVFEKLGLHGCILSSPIGDQKMDRILLENRRSDHIEVIHQGSKMAPIQVANTLRKGNCLLLAFDQDNRVESVFVDFFGRKAATPRNIAYLAQRYHCPIVSAFSHRLNDGTHQYQFERLFSGPYSKETDNTLQITQHISDALEKHIRTDPSQWVWIHRRWKTQPDD